MPQCMRSRRPYLWAAAFSVAVGLALFVLPGASAVTSAECDTQVNDTPSKLIPCITTKGLWNHMEAFQAIADANPSPADGHPSRNSGEPGYKASADYVAKLMRECGIQRHDPDVQVRLLRVHGYPDVQRSLTDLSRLHGLRGMEPRAEPRNGDCGSSAGRWDHHSADGNAEFVERLHRRRLQWLRSGPDRLDPTRGVQLRGEGSERPSRRGNRRHHLQRGQSRSDGCALGQLGRRGWESDCPDDSGGVHVVCHRRRPAHPISAGRAGSDGAAGHEPQYPGDRQTERR